PLAVALPGDAGDLWSATSSRVQGAAVLLRRGRGTRAPRGRREGLLLLPKRSPASAAVSHRSRYAGIPVPGAPAGPVLPWRGRGGRAGRAARHGTAPCDREGRPSCRSDQTTVPFATARRRLRDSRPPRTPRTRARSAAPPPTTISALARSRRRAGEASASHGRAVRDRHPSASARQKGRQI